MLEKDLYRDYITREDFIHAPYVPEMAFYTDIKEGNLEKVRESLKEPFHEKEGLGVLSESRLQNLKYHFVITTALIARFCIEGGMDVATAYGLSDIYIRKVDKLKRFEDITQVHDIMCEDYTVRMGEIRNHKIQSRHILTAVDYIYDHLNSRVKESDVAEQIGVSPEHLSRLFKSETGFSFSEYVMKVKIETAAKMLEFTDLSVSQLASQLAFSSQSHFSLMFKKYMGMTPSMYRSTRIRKLDMAKG